MKPSAARTFALVAASATLGLAAYDLARPPQPARRGAASELADIVALPAHAASAREAGPGPALDTGAVAQQRASGAAATRDAFPARSWTRAPAAAPPAPPPPPPPPAAAPPPQAPPLPYKYLGRLEQSGVKTIWYLAQGQNVHAVTAGETLAGGWRLDGFEAGQLRLTYLPLNIKQSLPIGAAK